MAAALPLCYHGAISRRDCETLLGAKNKDGSYLIRDSETIQGAMCLCVYKKHIVYTYRVLQTHSGNYTLLTAGGTEEIYFKSLDELIRHYKRKKQGLIMHLRHSVKRRTALLIKTQTGPEQAERNQEQNQHQSGPELPQRTPELNQRQRRSEASQRTPEQNPHRRGPELPPRNPDLNQLYSNQNPAAAAAAAGEEEKDDMDYENVPDYVDVQPI